MVLSPEEKIFIVHGVESNVRNDGREQFQYRPIDIETGLLPNCMGSAKIALGKTVVLSCVNIDTCSPNPVRPEEGIVEFFVHFPPTVSPEFEGRKGEQKSEQVSALVNKLYSSVRFDYLIIEPRVKCWKLNVDLEVAAFDGNLFDAISLAIKASLATSIIPLINIVSEDQGIKEYKISEDPSDTWTPNVVDLPCLVTVSKIGEGFIIDATVEEEQCSTCSYVLGITQTGSVVSSLKIGPGSLQPSSFISITEKAVRAGCLVNEELMSILKKEENIEYREIISFLT